MSLYTVNNVNQVTIGGLSATQLARQYGTPLQVFFFTMIRNQIQAFQKEFEDRGMRGIVSYASKAFSCKAIYQVVKQEHAHSDVVSGGEIATALAAGFPSTSLSFHGNNKSLAELNFAVQKGVGTIILDNFHELELLDQVLNENNTQIDVLLRVTPGVSAHTHSYIQTGQTDSKFGFDIDSGQALKAMRLSQNNPRIHLRGIHAHIGSQIFEVTGFKLEVKKLVNLLTNWSQKYQFTADILNIGGGFGIKYTHADDPLAPELLLGEILDELQVQYSKLGQPIPTIWIEPGRSIVGPAGFSLYTIGSRKDVPGLSPYVAVDGGMGDNIRPALYQADYEAVLAENPNQPPIETVRLAGKFCESGDILINHLPLPTTKTGDVLVMLATGAYGYSMASNYNRNPRPAVVFAENSQAQLVIQRETYADMIQNDLDY